jgi:hypothetical protein
VGLDCGHRRRARALSTSALLTSRILGDEMWRHVLYAICIVEAAMLAACLVVVVVEPDLIGFAPSPHVRQLCAIGALVLMVGSCYALVGWLRHLLAAHTGFNL